MSTYYVSLRRYWPQARPNRFVGEFRTTQEAQREIERVAQIGTLELVEDETKIPTDLKKAIQVSIMPKIAAKRAGLKSPALGDKKNTLIGYQIPTNIDEIDPIAIEKLKESHDGKKDHKTIIKKNGAVKVEENKQQAVAIIEATNDTDAKKIIKQEEDNKMLGSIKEFDTQNAIAGLREYYKQLADQTDPESEEWKPIDVTAELSKVKVTQPTQTDEFVIVSWFSGEREWIKRQGIDAKEIEGRVYSPEQLRGKIILGHIPNHLGYLAKEIWEIWTPYRKPDQKGKDLNADELQSAGAKFVKYVPARRIEGNNN